MELFETTEGTTAFFAPVQDTRKQFPPGTAPVFFNRRMELNRDATILLISVLRPSDYLDAMGATGVRGLRVAGECGIPVTINDRDAEAVLVIEKNVDHSGIPVTVTHRDVNALLSEESFDAVDLDPFGTAAPFVAAGVRGSRRYLFATATDTAPLCGAHLKAGVRRYGARPMNTGYHREVGLRILLAFVARETARYDRGIEPLFCFAREHFARLHVRLIRGAKAADETLARLGFVLQCPACPYREEQHSQFPAPATCPACGKSLQPIGPLWLGTMSQPELLDRMIDRAETMVLGTKKELVTILELCRDELPTASFYDYHQIAKLLIVSPPPIETVIERLRASGFAASRTHFSGYGVKTDAPLAAIYHAIECRA
jgi:tRNA (guanine26-N2/guanine27-N2)-dimethyltransferase